MRTEWVDLMRRAGTPWLWRDEDRDRNSLSTQRQWVGEQGLSRWRRAIRGRRWRSSSCLPACCRAVSEGASGRPRSLRSRLASTISFHCPAGKPRLLALFITPPWCSLHLSFQHLVFELFVLFIMAQPQWLPPCSQTHPVCLSSLPRNIIFILHMLASWSSLLLPCKYKLLWKILVFSVFAIHRSPHFWILLLQDYAKSLSSICY